MAKTQTKQRSGSKEMYIPGMNFGERQALRHYAIAAGMSPEKMARECISEMAYQSAIIVSGDNELRNETTKKGR